MKYFGQVLPLPINFTELLKRSNGVLLDRCVLPLERRVIWVGPKDMGFKFCSKAKVLGIEGLNSKRRASGNGTAEELDHLSPESPGAS